MAGPPPINRCTKERSLRKVGIRPDGRTNKHARLDVGSHHGHVTGYNMANGATSTSAYQVDLPARPTE